MSASFSVLQANIRVCRSEDVVCLVNEYSCLWFIYSRANKFVLIQLTGQRNIIWKKSVREQLCYNLISLTVDNMQKACGNLSKKENLGRLFTSIWTSAFRPVYSLSSWIFIHNFPTTLMWYQSTNCLILFISFNHPLFLLHQPWTFLSNRIDNIW